VSAPRRIVVAGAGIGGLTAALALAVRGHGVTVVEQSARLEEAGAGLQLSPNASRVLVELGLGEALRSVVVAPEALEVRAAGSGRRVVRMPLGPVAELRYGAPYWMLHRADLQAALVSAAQANPQITLAAGGKVEGFAARHDGVTVRSQRGSEPVAYEADALIGADGLWSTIRNRLGNAATPQFRRRTAWRSLVPAADAPAALRDPIVRLWLGPEAHLVHYPVCGGRAINIVAIASDSREQPGWSGEGSAQELMQRFPPSHWCREARALLELPATWSTWRLYDMPPLARWGEGPVTLLGDAAHPMLPFLAQGAALAIEDAAVLADALAQSPDVPSALRAYEHARRARVARVQAAARRNGTVYHLAGVAALVRDLGMRIIGGDGLLRRYDWIYRWCPPQPPR
jgi:salicylate hydroxylase